jgi:hypothetical protein
MIEVYNLYLDAIISTITQEQLTRIPFPAPEFSQAVGWNNPRSFEYTRSVAARLSAPNMDELPESYTDLYALYESYTDGLKLLLQRPQIEEIMQCVKVLQVFPLEFSIKNYFMKVSSLLFTTFVENAYVENRQFFMADLERIGMEFGNQCSVLIGTWFSTDPFGLQAEAERPSKIRKLEPNKDDQVKVINVQEELKRKWADSLAAAKATLQLSQNLSTES